MDINQRILSVFDDVNTFRYSETKDYIFERGLAKCRSDNIMLYKDTNPNLFDFYACYIKKMQSVALYHGEFTYYTHKNKLILNTREERNISITDTDDYFNTSLSHNLLPFELLTEIKSRAVGFQGTLSIYVDSM